jgi:hypothetical protein
MTFVALGGCMSTRPLVVDLPDATGVDVVDRTQPDDYPGFAAGEGNIYNCRYGIRHVAAAEFQPPRAKQLAAALAADAPSVAGTAVELQRFDVYLNYRLRGLNAAGQTIGGGIGAAIAGTGDDSAKYFRTQDLLVERNPDAKAKGPAGENAVGCDGRGEGEYYASQMSGGYDVVVTWLRFSVGERQFSYRVFFQFQGETPEERTAKLAEGVAKTLRAVARDVESALGNG